MATAIIYGAVGSGYSKNDICIYDIDAEKRSAYKNDGFPVAASEKELASSCETVFLTVKPVHLKTVLNAVKDAVTENTVFASVVAGVSTEFIQKELGKRVKVARIMPNTPALIRKGSTAVAFSDNADPETKKAVIALLEGIGVAECLPEELMNEIISVNGSSPAYVFMFIKALTDCGVKQGIEESVAKKLAIQAVIGSAELVAASPDDSIETLIRRVCSPNGTTLKAVESLEKEGFYEMIERAMLKCTERAKELEGEL